MTTRRRRSATLVASLLVASTLHPSAQQPPRMQPSSPADLGPPAWTRAVQMPDGRTFVTDGGMMVDAGVARPAEMPKTVVPVTNGEVLARNFTAPHQREIALGDLRPGTLNNTFETPDGIALNGNYVRFLGSVLSAGRTRLRTREPRDPVTVWAGDQPVAIVMPVAPPR
jgi:hypothetical protein